MGKMVTYKEVSHQWVGVAVVKKESGVYEEVELGVVSTPLKLKETGVKNLFHETGKVPLGTISIDVTKNVDVTLEYEMEVEDFKAVAKLVKPTEDKPAEEGKTE